jgi:hypothetical protein
MTDRKELIKRYKQTPQEIGVFQIKNTANGKVFIGSAKDLKGIMNSNRFQLKHGMHFNKELQRDYNQFGEALFTFDVLDRLKPKDDQRYDYTEDLKTLEELWLDNLQPFNEKGYHHKKAK